MIDWHYAIPIFISIVLFMMLATFVVYFLLLYQRSRVKLIKEQERLRQEMIKARLEIKEQTLNGISKQLHDSLGQKAALLKITLSMAVAPNGTVNMDKLVNAKEQTAELLRELKEIASGMNHNNLERIGIAKMLEKDADRIGRTTGTRIHIDTGGFSKLLRDDEEVLLYRVCQELLSNMLQHANATEVSITLKDAEKGVELIYTDNGKGFDPAALHPESAGGNGIGNMRERLGYIQMTMEIKSAPGQGVRIHIKPI